jgi:thiamine-phosphate pyrophosphorylase
MKLPRLYPILDTGLLARRRIALPAAAEEMLEAGTQILQVRHKSQVTRGFLRDLEAVNTLCRKAQVPLVVNDRADLALLLGAGLHIGQDDLPAVAARSVLGVQGSIGFSTHNEDQLRAAGNEPVDYLALGPVFGTASKENPDPIVGIEELRRLRPLSTRPLVAIGGITRGNALQVLAAGADSVAVISDLVPEDGSIQLRLKEWISLLS